MGVIPFKAWGDLKKGMCVYVCEECEVELLVFNIYISIKIIFFDLFYAITCVTCNIF
jgi:hypothetical protein